MSELKTPEEIAADAVHGRSTRWEIAKDISLYAAHCAAQAVAADREQGRKRFAEELGLEINSAGQVVLSVILRPRVQS